MADLHLTNEHDCNTNDCESPFSNGVAFVRNMHL